MLPNLSTSFPVLIIIQIHSCIIKQYERPLNMYFYERCTTKESSIAYSEWMSPIFMNNNCKWQLSTLKY